MLQGCAEEDMSAVLLGVYANHEAAERVRTDLVMDGFPTDRVELTDCLELGRAGIEPAATLHEKFVQYFRTLFCFEGERHYAEILADRIERGAATVTVHPRGAVETSRATEILRDRDLTELAEHDLANQAFEHAAAHHDGPWIRYLWVENNSDTDCIYCRLFARHAH
jgi:hypothetical protein